MTPTSLDGRLLPIAALATRVHREARGGRVVALTWPITALAQDAEAEAAIRAVVADQIVAWNAGDGQGYARPLAPEASFTNLFGMVM